MFVCVSMYVCFVGFYLNFNLFLEIAMDVYGYFTYMYTWYCVWAWCLGGHRCPGSEVTGGCELSDGGAGS